jgi:uncharacterized protein YndB with AHSA1/START domain
MSPAWRVESSAPSGASRETVWSLWSDVPTWSRWNPTLAEAAFDGPIAEGTTGALKPRKGPRSKIVLRDVRPGSAFTAESRLPGARLRIEHEVAEASEGGSRVTERAVIIGPLARLWSLLFGGQLERDMATAVEALARTAERV